MTWCRRCGANLPWLREASPCLLCWTGRAEPELVAELVARADDALRVGETELEGFVPPGPHAAWVYAERSEDPKVRAAGERARHAEVVAIGALEPLRGIVDERAAPPLRLAVEHPRPRVRAAVIRSLGRSGGRADVDLIVPLLDSGSAAVRSSVRTALAELGGAPAAAALAERVDGLTGPEREECVLALAWLRDPRALPHCSPCWPRPGTRTRGSPHGAWSVRSFSSAPRTRSRRWSDVPAPRSSRPAATRR